MGGAKKPELALKIDRRLLASQDCSSLRLPELAKLKRSPARPSGSLHTTTAERFKGAEAPGKVKETLRVSAAERGERHCTIMPSGVRSRMMPLSP
jgi:hypothetical protein